MSLALQCLLRLPAGLRGQTFLDAIPHKPLSVRPAITGNITRRAFSNSRQLLQESRFKKPTGAAPKPKAQAPPTRTATPPPQPTPQTGGKPKSYTDSLFESGREVLIYRAPAHRSFFLTSYIAGSLLLVGAYNWATLALKRPPGQEAAKKGWGMYIVTSISMLTTLFLAIAGTAIVLAPVKMIKTITALSPRSNGIRLGLPALRCEMRSPLPFMKLKSIEVLPSEAYLDRTVSAVEIDLTSIPLSRAQEFTATHGDAKPSPTVNRPNAVVRAGSTLLRDVRRMFYRDGFAYVRFKDYGNWKLDLQGCELLDNGRALERLTTPDRESGVGWVSLFRRKFRV